MIIFGRNPVIEALRSTKVNVVFLAKGQKDILELCTQHNVPVKFVERSYLTHLVKTEKHQGVASEVSERTVTVVDLLTIAEKREEEPFILILDSIQDPHNIGAIARSAEVFGVHGVILPERKSARISSTVWKTSAGAIGYIPVCYTNIAGAMEFLKRKDVFIVGADMGGAPLSDKNLSGPITLVMGSEDRGLRPLTRKRCDLLVSIPMKGNISSLNTSVAAGIMLYEISKQRISGTR
jgi:23S rRNA (guanosine2251-2'-O)-methyltransferase